MEGQQYGQSLASCGVGVGPVQHGEGRTARDLTAAPGPVTRWSQALHRSTCWEGERQQAQVEMRGSDCI